MINAVEIVTPNADFTRQVQVLGSPDGKNWNVVRTVLFSIFPKEKSSAVRA